MAKAITTVMAALLILGLAACSGQSSSPQPPPTTVIDDLGREVRLEKPPAKIISLAPSNTEILFALGLGDRVVGVTEFCNYPPEIEDLKNQGKLAVIGGFANPDLEKIIALDPDLILATGLHEKEVIPKLEERNLKVFALAPKSLDQLIEDFRKVGQLTGGEEAATRLIDQMRQRIQEVAEKVGGLKKRRVFYVTWHDPIWTAGSGTIANELIEKAGGINIFRDISDYKMVDLETVLARNPQVIIACTGHGESRDMPFVWAKEEPRLAATEARQNGRIYQIDADLITRAGPRVVEALEKLAYFIHPEVFAAQ